MLARRAFRPARLGLVEQRGPVLPCAMVMYSVHQRGLHHRRPKARCGLGAIVDPNRQACDVRLRQQRSRVFHCHVGRVK